MVWRVDCTLARSLPAASTRSNGMLSLRSTTRVSPQLKTTWEGMWCCDRKLLSSSQNCTTPPYTSGPVRLSDRALQALLLSSFLCRLMTRGTHIRDTLTPHLRSTSSCICLKLSGTLFTLKAWATATRMDTWLPLSLLAACHCGPSRRERYYAARTAAGLRPDCAATWSIASPKVGKRLLTSSRRRSMLAVSMGEGTVTLGGGSGHGACGQGAHGRAH